MPKFKEGDIVYCTIPLDKWDDSITVRKCGNGLEEMSSAVSGFPMEVIRTNSGMGFNMALLISPQFGMEGSWWFHEDDLEFFNISLENK